MGLFFQGPLAEASGEAIGCRVCPYFGIMIAQMLPFVNRTVQDNWAGSWGHALPVLPLPVRRRTVGPIGFTRQTQTGCGYV